MWWSTISPNCAARCRSAIAMPTALPSPWPSGPVVVSTPGVSKFSGCPGVFEPSYVKKLHGTFVKQGKTKMDLAEQLMADVERFKTTHGLDRCVAVWCGSTEVYREPSDVHSTLAKFEAGLKNNDENIAPSARVDVERNGQTLFRIAVEHGRRVAGQRITGIFLEALFEALRRECREVFEDGRHGSAVSRGSEGRRARRRRWRSLNQGRNEIRAGARWP